MSDYNWLIQGIRVEILHGKSLRRLQRMRSNCIDSVITCHSNSPDIWQEVLRVLKPGGHLLSFAKPVTYSRMTCAIEDAGFEIRDQILWLNKSHGNSIIFPAVEPIVLARKPLSEKTVAKNVLRWGTGAINVDGCRIEIDLSKESDNRAGTNYVLGSKKGINSKGHWGGVSNEGLQQFKQNGRWPANVLHDGSDEVLMLFPDRKTTWVSSKHKNNRTGEFLCALQHPGEQGFNDFGSAARFFYQTKPSKFDLHQPVNLIRYLIRLITPPDGVVLDPFAKTGTTGLAALMEKFDCVLIEPNDDYVYTVVQRFKRWRACRLNRVGD